ncbi:MAG: alpha/beta hydrolase, partial [Alphaproteobacteria bacterium]|nr:alpha/beta hydrolase [Alphaproteobacteria bacterium]
MPHVTISEDRLYYDEAGSGPPLFLLHGNAGSAAVWRKVLPRLAKSYRVIAHDRRGFGSSAKREDGDVSPQAYAVELARMLDALDIERAHIAGLSFGGMVAQCFALDFPDRLNGLVLAGTTPDRSGRNADDTVAQLRRDG